MESTQNFHNIFNTTFYPLEILVYFEKHRLFQILGQLLVELNVERPGTCKDVAIYIAKNIKRISQSVWANNIFLLTPPIFDDEQFVKQFQSMYKVPAILYKRDHQFSDTSLILEKLKKFLRYHYLNKKSLLFINFPKMYTDCLEFRKHRIEPSLVIEIKPGFQVPFKTLKQFDKERAEFLINFKEVQEYYSEIYETIDFGKRIDSDIERNNDSMFELCKTLTGLIENTVVTKRNSILGYFRPRIIILGRRGSGRKTQAKALAKRFKLVYVNMDILLTEYLNSPCAIGKAIRSGVAQGKQSQYIIGCAVHKRILRPDCIINGWVLVGYPNSVNETMNVFKFMTPPNKLIYIHCKERIALNRINKYRENKGLNYVQLYSEKFINKQMRCFNKNENAILEYLTIRNETIHIDGNHSFDTIRKDIWAKIEKQQKNNIQMLSCCKKQKNE